jgi:hypothetical protein
MRLDDQAPAQERLLRSGTSPELRLLDAAAQTRIVCVAGIRLDSRKSVRPFKGIICPDISEFESHMLSHAVRSLWLKVSGLFHTKISVTFEPITSEQATNGQRLPPIRGRASK